MNFVDIPKTDLRVAPICLGSAEIGAGLSVADALKLMDAFVELGGNFIDTAHVYSDWIAGTKSTSEKTIGQWMKSNGIRDQIVIGTKGGHPALATMHLSRLSHAEIEQDVDESLEYLQTDTIDLYWLHRDDVAIPVDEIIDSLNEQVAAGKIRWFGASNWTIPRIQKAVEYGERQGVQTFVANQPMWSLAAANMDAIPDKTIVAMDEAGLEFHKRTGMTVIPYSSQAHGFFGKLDSRGRAGISEGDLLQYDNAINQRRLVRIQALARQYGATVNEIALAYLLSQPFPTIPIVGCKRVDQLRARLKSFGLRLTPAEVASLENV